MRRTMSHSNDCSLNSVENEMHVLFHCDLYDSFLNKVFKITVHGVPCFCFFCLLVCFFQKGKISKKPRDLQKWTFLARMGQSSAYSYGGCEPSFAQVSNYIA